MRDILLRDESGVFGFRAAAVVVENGCVLLQKPDDDPGYAFPGGHVSFGEECEETLRREFQEEMGAQLAVEDMLWAAELFFPWGDRPCHQLCLYFRARLIDSTTPRSGSFRGVEDMEGRRTRMGFFWVPLSECSREDFPLYPEQCRSLLARLDAGASHFVYRA